MFSEVKDFLVSSALAVLFACWILVLAVVALGLLYGLGHLVFAAAGA